MSNLIQKFKSFPLGLRALFVLILSDISIKLSIILGGADGSIPNLILRLWGLLMDMLLILAIWNQSKKVWRVFMILLTVVMFILSLRLFINIYSFLVGQPLLEAVEMIFSVVVFCLNAIIYIYLLKKKSYFKN